MFSKFKTLLHTLSYLKPVQAIFQIKNRLSKIVALVTFELDAAPTNKLDFFPTSSIHSFLKIEKNSYKFDFLNLSKEYPNSDFNWNDQTHGKLWNYNLQYLDFLKQENLSCEEKIAVIKDLYSWLWIGTLPLEPYPVSLRIMNMIRFLETNQIQEKTRNEFEKLVLAEVNYLSQNLEYHILANHLLENAFALWMGANYFNQADWISKAERLLKTELEEQVLPDGAHFELAPMYHQIILFRVMEAYYLTSENHYLKSLLKDKAELMLGWLDQMTFANGTLPHFNDTTEGIALSSSVLKEIGYSLGLEYKIEKLKESGYRLLEVDDYKLIVDVEGIKPTYQPGHAHADTFSFVLYQGQSPIIVDPGISTYNISERRSWERSTLAHNTLTIDRKNSSGVWSGFRVGKRAKVKLLKDTDDCYSAQHDGFGKQIHKRTFEKDSSGFCITDQVINYKQGQLLEVRFFFHPDVLVSIIDSVNVIVTERLTLKFDGALDIQLKDYYYCLGYNKLVGAKCLLVTLVEDQLITYLKSV